MQGGWIGCSVSIRRRTEHGNNHCVFFQRRLLAEHSDEKTQARLCRTFFSPPLSHSLTLTLTLPPSLVGPPYASSPPFSSQRMCWCFSGTSSMLCHSTQCASLTHQLCVGGRLGWPLSGFACIEETQQSSRTHRANLSCVYIVAPMGSPGFCHSPRQTRSLRNSIVPASEIHVHRAQRSAVLPALPQRHDACISPQTDCSGQVSALSPQS